MLKLIRWIEVFSDLFLSLEGILLYLFRCRYICYWPEERVEQLQYKKLRKLLLTCEKYVPYYKKLFDDIGFDAARDFKSVADLNKLPIMTKETVRQYRAELINPHYHGRPIELKSSGSTGMPLSVLVSRKQWAVEQAMVWRHWAWNGYRFRDRMAIVRTYAPKDGKLIRWDHIRNFIYYSPFHLNDGNMKEYIDHMIQIKIRFIRGYPSSVKELASYVLRTSCEIPKLKGIFVASEVLSPEDRLMIEKAFHCKLTNWYGLTEGVVTMGECGKHEGMHVFEEYGYLELLDTDTADKKRIIGTTLNNSAMPLLRYETGDFAQVDGSKCSCGRTSRLVKNVIGRSSDVIHLKDRSIPLTNFYTVMEYYTTVNEWQIVQRQNNGIELIIHGELNSKDENSIREEFSQRLPEGVAVSISKNKDFIRKAEGKKTAFVSLVDDDQH